MTLTSSATTAGQLSAMEQMLLDQTLGSEQPVLVMPSNTRIDTGLWLRNTRLWLCVTGTKLAMFAGSRRQYSQAIEIGEAADTWYCHITGELVIAPARSLEFPRLKMSPTDALDVLEAISSASAQTSNAQETNELENRHA